MLCCVCRRFPADVIKGKAGFCNGCKDPTIFTKQAEEENAKDVVDRAIAEAYWLEKAKKKGNGNGGQ